ncbi:MAG: hypothetical protein KJ063_02325 [Anaerolineae bacterium]|nr:hypothetical protein [Anaerolineae bacterium]
MKFYVTQEDDCERCGGAGYVEHPAWTRFYAEDDGSWPSAMIWFREQGWHETPDDEIRCRVCGGTGVIERNVELNQALAAIGLEPGRLREMSVFLHMLNKALEAMANPTVV